MRSEGKHVCEESEARVERAIVLHLLDPDHSQDWTSGELGRVIAGEDPRLDPGEVEEGVLRLAALGLVREENIACEHLTRYGAWTSSA
jgi:hypothetical protein